MNFHREHLIKILLASANPSLCLPRFQNGNMERASANLWTLIIRVKAFPPFSVRSKSRKPTPGVSAIKKTAFKKVFLLQKQVLSLFYFVYKLKKVFGPFYRTYLISEKEAPKLRTGPAMNHSVLCLWFDKGAWVSSWVQYAQEQIVLEVMCLL